MLTTAADGGLAGRGIRPSLTYKGRIRRTVQGHLALSAPTNVQLVVAHSFRRT